MRMKCAVIAVCGPLMLGCASGRAPKSGLGASSGATETPLASMAGRQVIVLPVQRNISFPDSTWQQQLPLTFPFVAALDDSIASALGSRGLGASWTFARAISAAAQRNTGLLPDPHALAVAGLRRLVKAGDDPLSEPLASQVRSLVSMTDARYAVLPATLALESAPSGARASLNVYLIDARTARIQWSGAVTSEVAASLSAAMAGSIAQRLADLVVAR